MTVIDLANLTSSVGTTIFGADAGDQSGWSASTAGDVNGDGFDDLIIGAPYADASGNTKSSAGESYLIFGAESLAATIDLANLGSAGITIIGVVPNDYTGRSVNSAGDVNGDGFDDLIIGADGADRSTSSNVESGRSYVIFGAASLAATIDLANLGSAGLIIVGAYYQDRSGTSVSSAGDVNSDGFDDLLIGANKADALENAKTNAGDSYVIFGAATLPASIDLANLGSAGITIFGAGSYDNSGTSVSSAGDINGDGFDDLVIGALGADGANNAKYAAGNSYVLFGATSLPTTIDLAFLGSAGITFFGEGLGDNSGISVSSAGDVNGDGFDDMIIGAFGGDASGNAKTDAGDSYVIFGASSLPATIDLANLGSVGITIFGAGSSDNSGRSVSSAGDVNGDGFDDLIVGAPSADAAGNVKSGAGDSYVIFGAASLPTTIDLNALGSAGITIFGADADDRSGFSVSSAGDVNGDGFDDLIIGARYADALGNAKSSSGESYLLFGGNGFTNSILPANIGTSVANTLTGTSGAQIINGADGGDTMVGSGGADVLLGGRGDDTLSISDLSFKRIVGGNGNDTLRLDGSELTLDLTLVRDNRLLSIEVIDLTGTGNNTLTLTTRDVLNLSDSNNTLTVLGNVGDRTKIDDMAEGANQTIGPDTFRVFTSGTATLRVLLGVAIERTSIDLSEFGFVGTTIFGADAGDQSGRSVSNAGDVNGDGYDDLIIGAYRAHASGNAKSYAGESYVIFGAASLPATIDLASLGSAGFTIFGADSNDRGGRSVSSAGDVNGDGFDDLIIGAYRADASGNFKTDAGDSYVIFGAASIPATIDLANLGSAGITIVGSDANDRSGSSVSSAGDVNGDGFDDLIIGADAADASGNGKSYAGESYVIFGAATLPETIDLANLGSAGFTIFGADANDFSGISVSSAGDVNGDGFDDLIIGATGGAASLNAKSAAGDSYVIFGAASFPATIDLNTLGSAGITLFGAELQDRSGVVSSAGDFNGDGFDDLIIGAPFADASRNTKLAAGESYVIFGAAWLPATLDLANLGTGVTIFGEDASDYSGRSVSSAGDINGDGFDDLIIGVDRADALGNAKTNAGDSYVIFGAASPPATIDLSSLGSAGINIFGADAGDNSGISVSNAGDINGDGFDDLIIGARYADASGNLKSNAGESYVFFGGNRFTSSILPANLGTSIADTLTGTAEAEILNGADGSDTIVGGGGADVLLGGRGSDTLAISDLSFKRIVGGNGNDTLRIDGSGLTLDPTLVRDNRLFSIEVIDLTGTGNNSLNLTTREVLNLSDSTNTLTVRGDAGDRVNISDMTEGANQTIGSDTFRVFTQSTATLKVLIGVTIQRTSIDLSDVGFVGTTIFGVDANDRSGISVSNAGDVNGDGFDDLIIGARFADASGNAKTDAGESYVIFGAASLPSMIDLANLGFAGITIFGAGSSDNSGLSVSSTGDVNGDGFDDLIIGAHGADASGNAKPGAGDSYVIFGAASLPATIDLANLGSAGITIFGADTDDMSAYSVSGAGDVNGDGFDDLIIGAFFADASVNAKNKAGESYVIFGKANWSTTPTIDLASLGSAGITVFGAGSGDISGASVSSAGDINGDGFDDLFIGATGADASGNAKIDAGESYVIFGAASLPATIDLANFGSAGIILFGANTFDRSGKSVSSAGDVNGDGFDDLLIGAYRADASGNFKTDAGDSYLIFGAASLSVSLPATIDLANLGSAGITFFGADANDRSGISVSSAGDVNGDGFDDLIIGAHDADALGNAKSGAGDSYVIFGAASLPVTIDLANLGSVGITIFGAEAGDNSGTSVSCVGDVNGDGFDDLIIGAPYAEASGNLKTNAGESYVILGGNRLTDSILPANLGTSVANTLTGTAGAEILNGADGGDIIVGSGGADILLGSRGDDTLSISDLSFKRIVGGNGNDTLRLDGGGLTLDLTLIRDNRLLGIEVIDLTGVGNNSLILTTREVLNLSDSTNTLTVRGNADDVVTIGDMTEGTYQTIGPDTFRVFSHGSATLNVLLGVTIERTSIDLSFLGFVGTTIFGADAGDQSGRSVSNAGDVNGDGFDDLIIGAYRTHASGNAKTDAGESYVIFGAASLPATIDLANLGSAGFIIFGADTNDRSGRSVRSAGDVNGDGFDDLIIGARYGDASGNTKTDAGDSYVIFGAASFPATIDLNTLGSAGIMLFGADANDRSGSSVSSAGDVNGDGFDDLVVGALYADASGNAKSYGGESYVIFGAASLPATIDLANLGSAGITIFGADANDVSGTSVSSAGDVNGDGFSDLIIGATGGAASLNAKSAAGDSYVIFGAMSLPATIDLATLGQSGGPAGITLFGSDTSDRSGTSVSSAGDVNGDGFDDFVIGARSADGAGNAKSGAGDNYVIYGAATLPATIDLANLGSAGITIFGAAAGDSSGFSVSSAGDVNGDGFDDFVIGARYADASGNVKPAAGDSYVIFGAATLPATIDLANLISEGITFFGAEAGDNSGTSVSSAGDINGDGFDDLIIGARYADASGNAKSSAGESYVFLGGNRFTNSILPANLGTSSANTLTGTAGVEILNGADGSDIIVGSGGADVLLGGRGDDTLVISNLSLNRIVGGNGNDTLRLDGNGLSLNLATIPDNRIVSIESIDITGDGDNSLTLNLREVLNISDESNTLIVRRNVGDVVNIGSGWTQGLNQTIGPDTFHVYTQGAANLFVQANSVDTTPPNVTAIIATGSAWSPAFIDSVDGGGTGAGNGLGYALTAGLTLPNAGINRLYVQFSEPVVGFNASRLQLFGVNVANYSTTPGFLTVSYDSTNMRGFIQFASPITKDKLRIGVSDAITDVASIALDGDANAIAGGVLDFRFNVLVGDANNDGSVNGGDLPAFSGSFNKSVGAVGFNPRANWDSNDSVNGGDLPLFASNFNQSLPSSEPGSLAFLAPPPILDEFGADATYAPLIDDYFSVFDEEEFLLIEE